jgi:DNA-directed RNA polymerase specialized sigma24 family protein
MVQGAGPPPPGGGAEKPGMKGSTCPPSIDGTALRKAMANAELAWSDERGAQDDAALVKALALRGFEGPGWDRLCEDLAAYGLSVVRVWIEKGEIFQICRKKKVRIGGSPVERHLLSEDDATELALETVARALRAFRKVLQYNGWSPEGGANLRTFFVGQCLMQFGNVYRRWSREQLPAPWHWIVTLDDEHPVLDQREHRDLEETVMNRLQAELLLSLMSKRERVVLELLSDGWSYSAIGEVLGVTAKAVENVVYRFKRRMRGQGVGS